MSMGRAIGIFVAAVLFFLCGMFDAWSVGLALAGLVVTPVFFVAWLIDRAEARADARKGMP